MSRAPSPDRLHIVVRHPQHNELKSSFIKRFSSVRYHVTERLLRVSSGRGVGGHNAGKDAILFIVEAEEGRGWKAEKGGKEAMVFDAEMHAGRGREVERADETEEMIEGWAIMENCTPQNLDEADRDTKRTAFEAAVAVCGRGTFCSQQSKTSGW